MPAVTPDFTDASSLTCRCAAAIIGGRFVRIAGPRGADGLIPVEPCPAGEFPFGVAARDRALNETVGVWKRPFHILPVRAGAAIAAGDEVEVGPLGVAIPLAAGVAAGRATDDAANGTDCPVELY